MFSVSTWYTPVQCMKYESLYKKNSDRWVCKQNSVELVLPRGTKDAKSFPYSVFDNSKID